MIESKEYSKEREMEERVELILLMFDAFGKGSDTKRVKIYVDETECMPLETLNRSVTTIIRTRGSKEYFPCVADVLKPIFDARDKLRSNQWIEFRTRFEKNVFNRFGHLDDDVFTVKKIVGLKRFSNCTNNEYSWLMKEVKSAWEGLMDGIYDIDQDPVKNCLKAKENALLIDCKTKKSNKRSSFKFDFKGMYIEAQKKRK